MGYGKIRHPPTFDDFLRNRKGQELKKFHEALKFTAQDLEQIYKTENPQLLIGAGIATDRSDILGLKLLQRAAEKSPTDPVSWAALCYRDIEILKYEKGISLGMERIISDVGEFERIDEHNPLPLYFKAFVNLKKGNKDKAREQILEARNRKRLNTYAIDIRKRVVIASEYVNYSPFSARAHGVMWAPVSLSVQTIMGDIIKGFSKDKEVIEEIIVLGEKIESQSRLFIEKVIAIAFQGACLRHLGYREDDPELLELTERIFKTRERYTLISSYDYSKISESRWIKYFDDMFELGEEKAIQNLQAEMATGLNRTQ